MKKILLLIFIVISFLSAFDVPELVFVPSGSFLMGSDDITGSPVHNVTLTRSFNFGKYEITNSEYCDMLNYALENDKLAGNYISNTTIMNNDGVQRELFEISSNECEVSYSGSEFIVESGKENFPMNNMNWFGAAFYCNLLSLEHGLTELYDLTTEEWHGWECNAYGLEGYRLPTEAEFEYVGKYNDNRIYPWGDETPTIDHGNFAQNIGNSTEVGSYPLGMNSLGIYDMGGNQIEWSTDHFMMLNGNDATDPYEPVGNYRVFKGGSWWHSSDRMQNASRSGQDPNGASYSYTEYGFRIMQIGENIVGIEDNYELSIMNYELIQNYPNPFNPMTNINYTSAPLSVNQSAEIVVYNSLGQKVWSSGNLPFTIHHSSLFFDGSKFNSGIYYYSLVVDGKKIDSKSMILIK